MSDWIEELERLAKLRNDGILTAAEFESQKRKIISGKDNQKSEKAPPPSGKGEWVAMPPKHILNLCYMFIAFAIVGFTSIFFEIYEDDFVSLKASNLDSGVAAAIIHFIVFPLVAIMALLASNKRPERQKKTLAFLLPTLALFAIAELYESFNLFVISPLRGEESYGTILTDYIGPGAWLGLGSEFIAVMIFINVVVYFRSLVGSRFNNPSGSVILFSGVLYSVAILYPVLKVNSYYGDFTPFKDVIQGDGGALAQVLVWCATVLGICLLVARIEASQVRNWGVAGVLFHYVSEIIGTIALNADTENALVWSFGGTLLVFALIVSALILISNGLQKAVNLQSFMDTSSTD